MLVTILLIIYFVAGVATAMHLHDTMEMDDGYAILGGFIWPFVAFRKTRGWPLIAYQRIKNGYLIDFFREINKVTRK